MGTPAARSLVDKLRVWRVPLSFPAAQAWLAAHRPRGLRQDGSMTSGTVTGGTDMTGRSYRGLSSPAWQSADLEIGVARSGHRASVIRADAVIVWLDPRPVPSGPGSHPVRVTIARGCPASDRGVTGVTNPGAGLTDRLLPAGQPAAGLVCRYDGLNGRPFHLVSAHRLNARGAMRLASQMARLPLSHVDGGWVHCPMDDGSAEVIALAYPGRPEIDLWMKLNGCRYVSNGHIRAAL